MKQLRNAAYLLVGAVALAAMPVTACPTVAKPAPAIETVTPPKPKTVQERYQRPFPASVHINVGDSIVISAQHSGDPANFSPEASLPYCRTTDARPGEVLRADKSGISKLDDENVQTGRFTALRPGQAVILFWDFAESEYGRINVVVTRTMEQAGLDGFETAKSIAGFDNPKTDYTGAKLGKPVRWAYVYLNDIDKWKKGDSAADMLQMTNAPVSFPIYSRDGKLLKDVRVGIRDGSWKANMWGGPVYLKAFYAAVEERMKATGLEKEDFILVDFPGMSMTFVGYKVKKQWYLVNLFGGSRWFKHGQVVEAEKVFETTQPFTSHYRWPRPPRKGP